MQKIYPLWCSKKFCLKRIFVVLYSTSRARSLVGGVRNGLGPISQDRRLTSRGGVARFFSRKILVARICIENKGGPLAHLVERLICNEEVSGSSPLGSTFVFGTMSLPAGRQGGHPAVAGSGP